MAKKILIIDDEEDMRLYLQTLFRKAGYETLTAVNGDDALARLDAAAPDLITLDILMPMKSGLSAYEAIRSGDKSRNVPIIVVSGVTNNSQFFSHDASGATTVFADKPINPEALLEQVRGLLGE